MGMPMNTLLDHLISDELGTSAFLATVLDPANDDAVFVESRAAIADVLKRHGVTFSQNAPTLVVCEYFCIDIVAVWAPWVILIENKVAAASVSRGQLKEYYSVALTQLERKGFLPTAGEDVSQHPICVVYLTPTKHTGGSEFQSLEFGAGRRDMKVHIAWSELLHPLMSVAGKPDCPAAWFLGTGLGRVHKVLEAAKKGQLPVDDRRTGIATLMNDLKDRLKKQGSHTRELVYVRWSDRAKEQLYAHGPGRSSYVGLYMSYDGTSFSSNECIQPTGDMSFDVASKHRRRFQGLLAGKSKEEWSQLLGIRSNEALLNVEKGSIGWRFSLPVMSNAEFLSTMADKFDVFAAVFRETLMEPASQST
jgi:hypothetical protein